MLSAAFLSCLPGPELGAADTGRNLSEPDTGPQLATPRLWV